MADNQPYNEPDDQAARWMTFTELATLRGISKLSAVALVRRHSWRRQRDNQGHMTALVPAAWADTEPTSEPTDQPADQADISLTARSLAVLEDALAAIREAKDSEIATLHGVIDGLRASIARGEDRAGRVEQQRDTLRDRLNTMQEQLADAHAALQAAEEAKTRAERAEQGRDEERGRADRAEATTTAERSRADALRERIDGSERDRAAAVALADEAVKAVEALRRADTARKARGRLRRAWDGWRGR
jgi:hypothetical protein